MKTEQSQRQLARAQETVRILQEELAATNRGLMALTMELEQRVEERTTELRAAHAELKKTNSELLQLTLELEDRVDKRTAELSEANEDLRVEMIERQKAEAEIRLLNAELERRVEERTVQLQIANQELEAFSYSVSHDLRAPLRGIDGWSLALLEDYGEQLDGRAREYLDRVRSETQHMGQLIDDLLQLARVTRADIESRTVDLTAIAQAQTERLRKTHPDRQVEFILQADLTARADPSLLAIVMFNLFDNAFKFTGKHADARIEFGRTNTQGQHAFFVRDNGIGFDMAYASKLFGAFQRMHKTSDFPGTGIGLATVQRIIHRHGGQIWAEAQVNHGATFYFTLEGAE